MTYAKNICATYRGPPHVIFVWIYRPSRNICKKRKYFAVFFSTLQLWGGQGWFWQFPTQKEIFCWDCPLISWRSCSLSCCRGQRMAVECKSTTNQDEGRGVLLQGRERWRDWRKSAQCKFTRDYAKWQNITLDKTFLKITTLIFLMSKTNLAGRTTGKLDSNRKL